MRNPDRHTSQALCRSRPIKALGVPHNGPDVLENLLCLCPNDHARFDRAAIYIDPDHVIRQRSADVRTSFD
ncbi:MAG: putative restriction endonuclease [Actinomycetota bacterium]|jgi:putative restriction endonuclease|nr:putative restriction endonuclease [Actinomycetota bacterium]